MIFKDSSLHNIVKKTGFIACLFVFPNILHSQENTEYQLDGSLIRAYEYCLNFQLDESRRVLDSYKGPSVFGKIYLEHINDAIEVFVTEDNQLYEAFSDKTDERINQLKNAPDNPFRLYYLSEIRLHKSFINLKFGEEFSAAWNFRQAFQNAEKNREEYPDFKFSLKNVGLMHVIIGSTPEKYQWILNILGFHGTLQQGVEELQQFSDYESPFSLESDVILAFVYSYLLQDSEQGIELLKKYPLEINDNVLMQYCTASILIKASRSEDAIKILNEINVPGKQIFYIDYMKGNILLQKGDYTGSTQSLLRFLSGFQGHNYLKDANFKIGLNYWLSGENTKAEEYFDRARKIGMSITEADKNAVDMIDEPMPDRRIMQLRLLTDGGYFEEAENLAEEMNDSELENHKDSVEFTYRLGRLFHKTGNIENAIDYYRKTIEAAGDEHWYFAPNAALQLGYIFNEKGLTEKAREYFEQALSYKNHSYKNSIDYKAEAALKRLPENR